jgi:hypothetical protein
MSQLIARKEGRGGLGITFEGLGLGLGFRHGDEKRSTLIAHQIRVGF